MKKYIVIYHAPAAFEATPGATPEDMQKGMEQWMAWGARVGDGLVDWGSPLVGGQSVTKSGTSSSDKGVVGFSILQAEDMDGAKVLVVEHPHLEWTEGCSIEIHEYVPMPT